MGTCRVSEAGRYLAYALSVERGNRYISHIRSIDYASLLHVIRGSSIVSIELGSGNTFYYTESNDLNRPYCVIMQEIRRGILKPPTEIYVDNDGLFFVDVRKTKDNQCITITSVSKLNGNVSVLPASFLIVPRELKSFFTDMQPVEIAGKKG